jgi:cation diffusion facilitator CzcD-associated flavoprotein CzcO
MITPCEIVAAPTDFDMDALKRKYASERDKRLRTDAEAQYVEVSHEYAGYYEVDPWSPPAARDPLSIDTDVAVLGGGFGGLMAGANLRKAGIEDFRIIDFGGDFGGTWYWNRYPGVQCDIESYCYLPLLEETSYIPKEKYSFGAEIFEHCRRIARHFRLYERALFGTMVRSLRWDEALKRWRISSHQKDDIRARFLIMAIGSFNRPKLPGIPGITSFKGRTFHTSRWDYDYTGGDTYGRLTKLADKRVAIVGTGASAIQVTPYLADYAKHLYVLQRTPSSVDVRGNRPTDPEWAKSLKPGWHRERQDNYTRISKEGLPAEIPDLVCDGWTERNRALANQFSALARGEISREEIIKLQEIEDFKYMEKNRRRVDTIVKDKATAEKLKAWYKFTCKRPTFSDTYLPAFNRDNVTLIDVSGTKGVERITEKGFIAEGVEHEVDCIILASGFEVTTEIRRRLGIDIVEGRHGLSLYDHWKDGFKTFHGFTSPGFPNQFFTGFTQTAISPNVTTMLYDQLTHICHIIAETMKRGALVVEATREAQEYWADVIRDVGVNLAEVLADCTPGYFNNEGGPQKRSHMGDIYSPGIHAFHALLTAWRDEGSMKGLRLEFPTT